MLFDGRRAWVYAPMGVVAGGTGAAQAGFAGEPAATIIVAGILGAVAGYSLILFVAEMSGREDGPKWAHVTLTGVSMGLMFTFWAWPLRWWRFPFFIVMGVVTAAGPGRYMVNRGRARRAKGRAAGTKRAGDG